VHADSPLARAVGVEQRGLEIGVRILVAELLLKLLVEKTTL
jgi:hypothetical protein